GANVPGRRTAPPPVRLRAPANPRPIRSRGRAGRLPPIRPAALPARPAAPQVPPPGPGRPGPPLGGRPATRRPPTVPSRPAPLATRARRPRLHPEPPPRRARPQPEADLRLGLHEGPVTAARLGGEVRRRTVFHDAAAVDHPDALETEGLLDVVGDAKERGAGP